MARRWNAKWVGHGFEPGADIGVFGFRRKFEIVASPPQLLVNVSADQRYKLFVNGELVSWGPQRGEPRHWFFETVDLGPGLRPGANWLAALVWNFGWMAPMAQTSTMRTAFVLEDLQGDHSLSTPHDWEVLKLENWRFAIMHRGVGEFYIDVGPGEIMDARGAPWGWRTGEDDQEGWRPAHVICQAEEREAHIGGTPWMLVARAIPMMEYRMREKAPTIRNDYDAAPASRSTPTEEPSRLVLEERRESPDVSFVAQEALRAAIGEELPLDLGPKTSLLLDFGELICGYPRIALTGPSGAEVTLTYDESLWMADGTKGHRDEVAGKHPRGYQDRFILDGNTRTFEPLWWRTWRYILIETGPFEGPGGVRLERLDVFETGYPLQVESTFEVDEPWVERIWEVGVRTSRRCAGETYFDCPYYEQLQYIGDTRIQALIGYYLGRDRSLQRNAVETLAWSLMENGLTQSRYPARQTQIIPPFSLWWVVMLWDQLLYDTPLIEGDWHPQQTAGRRVVEGYGFPGESTSSFWNFVDWVPDWRAGVPPGNDKATANRILWCLANSIASRLSQRLSGSDIRLGDNLLEQFLTEPGGLVKSSTDADWQPSEHAEAMLRFAQLMHGQEASPWPGGSLAGANAARCTFYFSYYKHLAMSARDDAPFDYMAELAPWKEMIESGLTTFAENPEPTRSDCHAWSAHPILGFFQIVAGVTSIARGWERALIAPKPGSLRRFSARIAHPAGDLNVRFEEGKVHIESPVPFRFRWREKEADFEAGAHSF